MRVIGAQVSQGVNPPGIFSGHTFAHSRLPANSSHSFATTHRRNADVPGMVNIFHGRNAR